MCPDKNTPVNEMDEDEEGGLAVIEKQKLKRPKRYKVLIYNDDYTTMEFVVEILKNIFSKTHEEAAAVMLKVHNEGHGVCGVYTKEIAESKADRVIRVAKTEGFPLKCTIEAE